MGFFTRKKSLEKKIGSGKVIAFLNQKGGVGKTTLAFNTAKALEQKGHKVLCIDLDPQANLTHLFDIKDEHIKGGIFQLLINQVSELKNLHQDLTVQESIIKKNNVAIIPASNLLSGLELTVAGINSPRQLILKNLLERNDLLDRFDYVVIDGPPTLGLIVVNILCASHGVMIPFRPDGLSRKGLGNFYEVLEQIDEMGVSEVPKILAYIPNLMDTRRKQESDDLSSISEDIKEFWGESSVVEPFYNRVGLVKATAEKKTVFEYSSQEFKQLQNQFGHLANRIGELESGVNNVQ